MILYLDTSAVMMSCILACAFLWKETLETQITMATFDRDLW